MKWYWSVMYTMTVNVGTVHQGETNVLIFSLGTWGIFAHLWQDFRDLPLIDFIQYLMNCMFN